MNENTKNFLEACSDHNASLKYSTREIITKAIDRYHRMEHVAEDAEIPQYQHTEMILQGIINADSIEGMQEIAKENGIVFTHDENVILDFLMMID